MLRIRYVSLVCLTFDVFASDDVKYIDELNSKGEIVPGTERFYAQGRIAIATRATGSLQVKKIGDLTSREIKKLPLPISTMLLTSLRPTGSGKSRIMG